MTSSFFSFAKEPVPAFNSNYLINLENCLSFIKSMQIISQNLSFNVELFPKSYTVAVHFLIEFRKVLKAICIFLQFFSTHTKKGTISDLEGSTSPSGTVFFQFEILDISKGATMLY